jgi:tetratricopeptide (TPR) repeat protein
LALSLAATGDNTGSQAAFRKSVASMEIAIEIDPADLGSPLRLAVTLLAFSKRLQQTGDSASAHQTAQDALALLERATQKPSASAVEWNEYADALLKVEQPDLVQPAKALLLAQNAVAATHRTNPFFLDTLAWAYYRSGEATKAAETEREALNLLPAGATGGLHDELQSGLATFTK